MRLWISSIVACLLCLGIGGPNTPQKTSSAALISHPESLATSHFIIEVRLRKLHLARPDLIPYPLETEVYC
jgi:hypothetical protein